MDGLRTSGGRGREGCGVARRQHLARNCASAERNACGGARLGGLQIAETHHRKKIDAPSGTPTVGESRGTWPRSGAVGYASLCGTAAGDHDAMFLGPDERVAPSHRAESRMIFARGTLAGARFLVGLLAFFRWRDVIEAL